MQGIFKMPFWIGTFLYFITQVAFAITPTATSSLTGPHNITLTWDTVPSATHYQVQKQVNGIWEEVSVPATNLQAVTGLEDGEHTFRVSGCVEEVGVTIHCGDAIAEYSAPYSLTLPLASTGPNPVIDIATAPAVVNTSTYSNDTVSAQVGTMGGQFRVDESGSATYSVPLTLPQGIAGSTPQFSLNYSSSAGNGPLGVGWNVSGLSAISRCRPTNEQDDFNLQLTLSNDDRFCLDGQKLVAVSGNYGVDGTEYRTEVDSRARVISYGTQGNGPAYFTVEREDGSTSYYGGQSASGSLSSATLLADNTGVVWSLTRITDNMTASTGGIVFEYIKGQASTPNIGLNEIVISKVSYSGNEVSFNYKGTSTREDLRSGFVMGALVTAEAQLDNITVKNHSNTITRTYTPSYEIDAESKVQRINSITECGLGGTTCLPATTFDWYNREARSWAVSQARPLGNKTVLAPTPLDADGDGYTDFAFIAETDISDQLSVYISYNRGSGLLGELVKLTTINIENFGIPGGYAHRPQLIPSDIDGDGRVELVFYTKTTNNYRWKYYDFNDSNVIEIQNCTDLGGCTITNQTVHIMDTGVDVAQQNAAHSEVLLHDFNGDAMPDMVFPTFRLMNDGNGQFTSPAIQSNIAETLAGYSGKVISTSRSSTIADAQNHPDHVETLVAEEAFKKYGNIYKRRDGNPTRGLRNPQDITNTQQNAGPTTIQARSFPGNIPPMDFNGDGAADVVIRMINIYRPNGEPVEGDTFWAVYNLEKTKDLNGNYQEPSYQEFHTFDVNSLPNSQIYGGDLNGDGLGDLIIPPENLTTNIYSIYLSNGKQMLLDGTVTFGAAAEDTLSITIQDINSDGRTDILYFDKTEKQWEILYQQTDGSFEVPAILASESTFDENHDAVFLTDWTADGEFGLVHLDDKVLRYRPDAMEERPGNFIRSITNGFNLTTDISYGLLTDNNLYTKGVGAENLDYGNGSSVFDLIYPGYAVSSVTSDAPGYVNGVYETTNELRVDYFYKGMRAQSGGRGSLGFEKLYTYDFDRGITTETTYRQDFPYTGMPISTKQYMGARTDSPAANQILSESTNTYVHELLQAGKTVFPYLDFSEEISYAVNDAGTATQFLSKVVTDNAYTLRQARTYDTSGVLNVNHHANLTTITVTTKNTNDTNLNSYASKVTTSNGYAVEYDGSSVNDWWLGRVTSTGVTHQRQSTELNIGDLTIARSSTFQYHPSGVHKGMLKSETVSTPSGMLAAQSELTTLHCYDDVGNKIKTITSSNSVAGVSCATRNIATSGDVNKAYRYQGATFDTDKRYAINTQDALFTVNTVNSRNAFGQATQVTDINNVVSFNWYDDFGRQFASANSIGQGSETKRHLATTGTALGSPVISSIDSASIHFIEKTTPVSAPIQYKYFDVMGRQVAQATQGFDGTYIVQTTKYDQYGQVIAQSNPYKATGTPYFTTSAHDKFGRVQSIVTSVENGTTPGENSTQSTVEYANNGLSSTTSVSYNSITQGNQTQSKTEVRSVLGETVSVTDAAGTIQYFYNATGSLTKVKGVDDVEIQTTFDKLGRKTGMVDPDKGTWAYQYNALGELTQQTDARGHITKFYRDSVGRTITRSVSGNGVTENTNYSYKNGALVDVPKLQSEQYTESVYPKKSFTYDSVGRPSLVTVELDATKAYTLQTTYDQHGRVFQQFDADESSLIGCVNGSNTAVGACWGTKNTYNTYGYLESQEEARYSASADTTLKTVFQTITEMDAFGNVTSFTQNNDKITSTKVYDQQTGYIKNINTNNGSPIQVNEYQFDAIGNLRTRTRHALKKSPSHAVNVGGADIFSQSFSYDNVNRLTHIGDVEHMQYENNGNIKHKLGVGNYCYNSARPHAVSGIGAANCTTQDYQYDANGNMTSGRGRTITYAHYDKPTSISNTAGTTDFVYDTARKRFKRTTTANGKTTTTWYIGNTEVVNEDGVFKETRRYLPNAIQTRHSTGVVDTRYLHKDHLGSIDTITNKDGKIIEKVYFDVWGKRESIDSSQWNTTARSQEANTLVSVLDITPRGFTGHEHVDHADIIHMNGRIYDPTLGRFLQADPFIQGPKNSQSLNRYSYVLNNPLSYTDPSGYFANPFKKIGRNIIRAASKIFGKELVNIAGNIASLYCGPAAAACAGAWNYEFSRAMGASSEGAFFAAFHSAAAAVVFQQIGGNFSKLGASNVNAVAWEGASIGNFVDFGGNLLTRGQVAAQIASHAVAGGVFSVLQGGKFGHGFFSAGVTKGLGGAFLPGGSNLSAGQVVGGTVVSAIIGGTASVISGGKFANGARTASFQFLFNQAGKSGVWNQLKRIGNDIWRDLTTDRRAYYYPNNSRPRQTVGGIMAEQAGAKSIVDYNVTTQAEWAQAAGVLSLTAIPFSTPLAVGLGFGGGYLSFTDPMNNPGNPNSFIGSSIDATSMGLGALDQNLGPLSQTLGRGNAMYQFYQIMTNNACMSPYRC